MIQRREILGMLGFAAIAAGDPSQALAQPDQLPPPCDHSAWVDQALMRMLTIKPGMTREALLDVFTTEGGLSTGLQRTYVSRNCPYFKVDVEFQAVGRSDKDSQGRVTVVEDRRDSIQTISRPYLDFIRAD